MIVYQGRWLKKSSNRKLKLVLSTLVSTWLSNIALHLRPTLIRLQTLVVNLTLAIDSPCVFWLAQRTKKCDTNHISRATAYAWHRFQALARHHLKSLCLAWQCAIIFESEQKPIPRTGRQFRSAPLHRIRFGACCFVPMSYFYWETNDW